MSISLFRVGQGIEIEKDDLSAVAAILIGTGLPGGDSAEQDNAPIGSTYHRTDSTTNKLNLFVKIGTSNNSSADWEVQTSKSYVDAAIAGLKWREPVLVLDPTLYADNSAFPTTGIIDGVTLVDESRVLFTNVAVGSEENVWIWNSTLTSWTEDTKQELDGDAVLVKSGTFADQQWTYNGTEWVQIGNSDQSAEIGFNRDFMGKTGPGAEMPTYSTTNVVSDGTSLEVAIGALDTSVGNQTYTEQNLVVNGETITVSIDSLDIAIGNQTYTDQNFVTNGESTTSSIDALDVVIGDIQSQNQSSSGTAINASAGIVIDTIPLAEATEAKWMIQVRDNAIPGNRRSSELHALNDGSSLVDLTVYATLKIGAAIPGFKLDVDIVGSDMRLVLTTPSTIDYVVKRISYSAF